MKDYQHVFCVHFDVYHMNLFSLSCILHVAAMSMWGKFLDLTSFPRVNNLFFLIDSIFFTAYYKAVS